MRALVVGASAGVGRALSEALAARGDALLLVASDARDLEAQAAHLRLVYGVQVETVAADASPPEACLGRIRQAADAFGAVEALFFPIGVTCADDRGTLPLDEARRLFDANLLIVISVIGHFLPAFVASDNGIIVGFGSVAAIRGRRANIVYAAAKRGLESYFESLRHLTATTNIRVHSYNLGYTDTQQTFGKRLLFPACKPEQIAQAVVARMNKPGGSVYFPAYWRLIAWGVHVLPWPIFRRMNF